MTKRIELLEDIIGVGEEGIDCHPFKGVSGEKAGLFSISLQNDNKSFVGVSEEKLRSLIEAGEFNERGRIRMVSKAAKGTSGAGALHPRSYKGQLLPIRT